MRRTTLILAALALAIVAGSSHGRDAGSDDPDAYRASVEAWRSDRLARLKAPDGYLNLAGLYWLDQGRTSFGSGADNDIVFPAGPASIGSFDLRGGTVTMTVHEGIDVRVNQQSVRSVVMPDDTGEAAASATLGSLAWAVINREGKIGLRLHDQQSAALHELPPIPYFDISPAWRVRARLKRYERPRVMAVNTVIEGLGWNPESPGVVDFELGGVRHTLEAYQVGERLFFVFGDKTSGRVTYPAGRFLYAPMPGEDGVTELDFNLAYNPPCAFNDFSTCPVASPQNRLAIAVTAGEKFDPALYRGSTH